MNNTKPPYIGNNTNHHDQPMYPVNFSVMNTIVSSPKNPIPVVLAVELVFDIVCLLFCDNSCQSF